VRFDAPCVVRRHGARFAIVTDKGRTLYGVVEMTKGPLILRRLNERELLAKGYAAFEASPSESAGKFLKHQAGVTPNAKAALDEVIALSFLE